MNFGAMAGKWHIVGSGFCCGNDEIGINCDAQPQVVDGPPCWTNASRVVRVLRLDIGDMSIEIPLSVGSRVGGDCDRAGVPELALLVWAG